MKRSLSDHSRGGLHIGHCIRTVRRQWEQGLMAERWHGLRRNIGPGKRTQGRHGLRREVGKGDGLQTGPRGSQRGGQSRGGRR